MNMKCLLGISCLLLTGCLKPQPLKCGETETKKLLKEIMLNGLANIQIDDKEFLMMKMVYDMSFNFNIKDTYERSYNFFDAVRVCRAEIYPQYSAKQFLSKQELDKINAEAKQHIISVDYRVSVIKKDDGNYYHYVEVIE